MIFRDILYNIIVKGNKDVDREYDRYVKKHLVEHYENRKAHYKVLIALNWHYRVLKRNYPPAFLYKDEGLFNANPDVNILVEEQEIQSDSEEKQVIKKEIESAKKKKSELRESISTKQLSKEKILKKVQGFDVISFDMFDTLVFRAVSDPKDVFRFVGNDLCIPNFKAERKNAEQKAREIDTNSEPTINEIYELLGNRFSFVPSKGIALEIYYEKKLCFANPIMFEVYKELVKQGKHIIVTSNMYLGKDYLKEILRECGYHIDEIYVSCDLKLNKKLGTLQTKIHEMIGFDKKIIHIGDNYQNDVEGSRIAGWSSLYYKNVNVVGNSFRPNGMTVIPGKIYKGLVNAKLHSGKPLNAYFEYGYAYAGYLVYGFCKWLDDISRLEGIDRLWFVSRDMNIVYEIYKKIGHCASDYIKASRTSSIHLSFDRQNNHFIEWHLKRKISKGLSIMDVLEELEISFLAEKLITYGLDKDEVFATDNFDRMKQLICDNKEPITNAFAKEKEAAEAYYGSMVGNAKKICIVDMGWKSSTYRSLSYFLNEECGMNVDFISAMVGMEGHEYVDEWISLRKVFTYVFSSQDNSDYMTLHNSNGNVWRRLYEIIFTSNEQSLLGFNLDENNNVCFDYLRKEVRNDDIVTQLHKGIYSFAQDFSSTEERLNTNLYISGRDAIKPLISALSNNELNYSLFKDFEVCFTAGNVKSSNVELFKDVVSKEA